MEKDLLYVIFCFSLGNCVSYISASMWMIISYGVMYNLAIVPENVHSFVLIIGPIFQINLRYIFMV